MARDSKSLLTLCWAPESSVWRELSATRDAEQAHCKIENLVIGAFRQAWLVHQPLRLGHALVNSPLSGKSLKRGRNLLSFTAFNGFRRLALWGKLNGAGINQTDADLNTFLGTAIADNQPYMVDFGLFYLNADPNIIYGKSNRRVTALRDAIDHLWTIRTIDSFVTAGAVTRNQNEYEFAQAHLVNMAGDNQHRQLKTRDILYTLYLAGTLVNPQQTETPVTMYTDMLDAIDRHILYAIKEGHFIQEEMDAFWVHGRNFYHFLAFNGFSRTLKYLMRYALAPEYAKDATTVRSDKGYDMLLAAIHSNNVDAVIEVLNASNLPINLKVPSFNNYKNQGKKPLDLAREWGAPEVIKVLIKNGATPSIR